MDDPLRRVKRATRTRDRAEAEWRAAVRAAVQEGVSLRSTAAAAGVSHVRVLQISREP